MCVCVFLSNFLCLLVGFRLFQEAKQLQTSCLVSKNHWISGLNFLPFEEGERKREKVPLLGSTYLMKYESVCQFQNFQKGITIDDFEAV